MSYLITNAAKAAEWAPSAALGTTKQGSYMSFSVEKATPHVKPTHHHHSAPATPGHHTPSPAPGHESAPTALSHVWAWLAVALVLAAVAGWLYHLVRHPRPKKTRRWSLRARLWMRMHPGPGFAKRWELVKSYGLTGPRRAATRLRPSLDWADRWLGAPGRFATYLGVHRVFHRLYVGLEETLLLIGIPRSGKSGWLAGRIIDAPGAVVATSLRGDLIRNTIKLRRRPAVATWRHFTEPVALVALLLFGWLFGAVWGLLAAVVAAVAERLIVRAVNRRAFLSSDRERPVWIFDPQNVSGMDSSLNWSPVMGAQDANVARAHAAYMVEAVRASGVDNQNFWENSAARALRGLLHAAALGDKTLMDVFRWALSADQEPLRILRNDARAAAGYAEQVEEFVNLPEDTRKSVMLTLSNVLDFMSDATIAGAVCSPFAETFNVEHFIESRGTLYLVADDKAHSPTAPLFAALVGEVNDRARELAARNAREQQDTPAATPSRSRRGRLVRKLLRQDDAPKKRPERLDPPLTLVLDEVANIVPIPLAAWAATSAGWGIQLIAACQNIAQLVSHWSPAAADDIMSNLTTKMIWGGLSVPDHLNFASELCGPVQLKEESTSISADGTAHRTRSWREVPVATPDAIRKLPCGYALVVSRAASPTVVRTERVWKRRDVKVTAKRPTVAPTYAQQADQPTPARREPVQGGIPLEDLDSFIRNGFEQPTTAPEKPAEPTPVVEQPTDFSFDLDAAGGPAMPWDRFKRGE